MVNDASPLVLVVDDDQAVSTVLCALLDQGGFRAHRACSGPEALELLDKLPVDVVLTDMRMPGMDGLELLRELSARRAELPVILLTAHGTVPLAVEAMKAGAQDFLLKPFDREEVLFTVRKALLVADQSPDPAGSARHGTLVGDSPPMRENRLLLERVAVGTATVLIRGESGTGKELIARAIHAKSPRHGGPFVKIHCGALPDGLLESELFGYEKGAFTGAATRKPGRIEHAHGGTLFLDEIGDTTLAMQVKLLRVLQEKAFERLGGHETLRVDVRFLAATHRDLDGMVERGQFREDLYYRLNVVPFWLPPLRERPGDVERLARHFAGVYGDANGKSAATLRGDALALLAEQPWPGNVRELENFMERLVVLSEGTILERTDVERELRRSQKGRPSTPSPSSSALELGERLRQSEREALQNALEKSQNNRTLAARLLGISRRSLYKKLETHGIE